MLTLSDRLSWDRVNEHLSAFKKRSTAICALWKAEKHSHLSLIAAGRKVIIDETISNLGASQPLARAADRAERREGGMGQGRGGAPSLFSPQV